MEGHASRTQQTLPVAVQEKHQPKAELLTRTLQSALEQRASDIHIEPADNAYRIRLRIDGVLHPLPEHQPKAELLTRTLQSALEQRASDIHIEPADNAYRIRLRIDGVLHPLPDVSPDAGVALTARLKVLGNLDIAEHRLPQDGQFTVELAGNAVSFRIATTGCRSRINRQIKSAGKPGYCGTSPAAGRAIHCRTGRKRRLISYCDLTMSGW